MAGKYPALVWCHAPNRIGCVKPELWYDEVHSGQHGENGTPIVKSHAAFHTLKPEDAGLDIPTLARIYPPPAGLEWRKIT